MAEALTAIQVIVNDTLSRLKPEPKEEIKFPPILPPQEFSTSVGCPTCKPEYACYKSLGADCKTGQHGN